MRGARSAAAMVLAVSMLITAPADVARASCGGPFRPKRAPWVFVGTAVRQTASHAVINVEQVWRGRDLAPEILLKTGQDQPPWPLSMFGGLHGSGDIALKPGRRYVVGLEEGPVLRTNSCVVVEATPKLLAKAPPDAREPVPGALSGMSPARWIAPALWGGVALGLIAAMAIVVRRRRRRS